MSSPSRPFALLVLLSLAVLALPLCADIPGSSISEERVKELVTLTQEVSEARKTLLSSEVLPEVEKRYHARHPEFVKPTVPLLKNQHAVEWTRNALAAKLDEQIPLPSQEEQNRLAAEKYPIYKVGDRVRVTYWASTNKRATIEGVITALRNGNVQINNSVHFAVTNMKGIEGNEAETLKMDARRSGELRQAFIEEMMRDLEMKRQQWAAEHREEILQQGEALTAVENEQNGYTFFQGLWLEPADLVQEVVTDTLEKSLGDSSRFASLLQRENRASLGGALQDRKSVV